MDSKELKVLKSEEPLTTSDVVERSSLLGLEIMKSLWLEEEQFKWSCRYVCRQQWVGVLM